MRRHSVAVFNSTREVHLADHAELATTAWKLLVGLMPYRRLDPGEGMVLPCIASIPYTASIHTAFLRFPIDVAFLDKAGRILRLRSNVRPFRIVWAPRGAHTAIELPSHVILSTGSAVGDTIKITRLE